MMLLNLAENILKHDKNKLLWIIHKMMMITDDNSYDIKNQDINADYDHLIISQKLRFIKIKLRRW